MTTNPHGPAGNQDPSGNTQMFRAFVDEGGPQRQPAPDASAGPRLGLIAGVVAAVVIIVAVAWLALA